MELAVGASESAMSSLLGKLCSLLAQEYTLISGVRSEDNTSTEMYAVLCEDAVRESEIAAPPADVATPPVVVAPPPVAAPPAVSAPAPTAVPTAELGRKLDAKARTAPNDFSAC